MRIPRILISAGASGSGKTLITCGILQALKDRGMKAASFKCGPDYIDPMFHTRVIGTQSRNLDTFFTDDDIVRYLLAKNSEGMDIAVMEGVMGYYDGAGGTTTKAGAYDLAAVTDTPSVLVVNCKGMSLSIVPYIKGFCEYRENSMIKGVILNRMPVTLYSRMKKIIEEETGVRVIGYVPEVPECALESRHLGLIMPYEIEGFHEKLTKLARTLENTLELDALLEIADTAPEIDGKIPWDSESDFAFRLPEKVKIGVAYDEAFCFSYEDNIRLLKEMGAEIVEFSPVRNKNLPEDIDGMILSGGYPELYAYELEDNKGMKNAVLDAYSKGMPIIAECGGFMYMHELLEDVNGEEHRGVGIIKGKSFKTDKLGRFGYITLSGKKVFGEDTGKSPAHEFHYFDSDNCGEDFTAEKPFSTRSWKCIHAGDNLLAGFPHFYYYGNPALPKAFLKKCLEFRKKKGEL